MPVDNSIALQTKTQSGLTGLGDMLNLARGAQQYQQTAEAFPVELQRLQQSAEKERLINPELVTQAQETSKQTQFKTKQDYAEALNKSMTALMQDPTIIEGTDPNAMAKKIAHQRNMAIRAGVPIEEAEIGAAHLIAAAHQNPRSVVDMLGNAMRSNISAATQQASIAGLEETGPLSPSNNPTVIRTNPNTGERQQFELPEGQPPRLMGTIPSQPGKPKQTLRYTGGENPESVKDLRERTNEVSRSSATVNQGVARVNEIEKVVDSIIAGKGGQHLADLSSQLGYRVLPGEEEAAARAVLKKDMAGLIPYVNQATGGKYAGDLANAAASIADPDAPIGAIKTAMKQVKPILLHTSNLNEGLQKVLKRTNGDVAAQRQYMDEMGRAYDPDAILIDSAFKNKNIDAAKELLKNKTPDEIEQIKEKAKRYRSLVNGVL